MDLNSYKNSRAKEITKSLENLLSKNSPKIKYLETHYQSFSDSHFGGKYLRGMLVCLGYEIAGKEIDEAILKIASAFEMLHTSLLIHDDIIDQSVVRRGRASLHVALGDEKKGESLALCFGDLGIISATQAINNSIFTNKLKNKALDYFCENIKSTIYGQLLDVELSKMPIKDEKCSKDSRTKNKHVQFCGSSWDRNDIRRI